MKKIIIWIIITGALVAFGIYYYVFHYAAKHADPLESKNKVEITAEKLFADYKENSAMADSLYIDKTISIRGRVNQIEMNDNRYTITFDTKDSTGAVICEMDTVENAALKSVQPGAEIHVVGFCNGYNLDVELDRGKLAK